jgi:hypothetical protein
MSATVTTRENLEKMTVAQLTDLAQRDYQIAVQPKTKKVDIVSAIVAAQELEEREAREREEARKEIEIVPLAEQVSVLAQFKDSPENGVETPMPGTSLTREQIAERISAARAESEEAAAMRKAAEAAKPRRSDDVSIEELTRRYHKIGYGVGLFIQAMARLRKETRKADDLTLALGEEVDREVWDLCRDSMVEGYAKCWDTYKFPSKALRGMDGEEMVRGIWAEMMGAQPALAIFAQFESSPVGSELDIEEEE